MKRNLNVWWVDASNIAIECLWYGTPMWKAWYLWDLFCFDRFCLSGVGCSVNSEYFNCLGLFTVWARNTLVLLSTIYLYNPDLQSGLYLNYTYTKIDDFFKSKKSTPVVVTKVKLVNTVHSVYTLFILHISLYYSCCHCFLVVNFELLFVYHGEMILFPILISASVWAKALWLLYNPVWSPSCLGLGITTMYQPLYGQGLGCRDAIYA